LWTSLTQALKYLRDVGMAQGDDKAKAEENERAMPRWQHKAPYPY
jgi:hypothetical protein